MSSIYFESEDSSSGRLLNIQNVKCTVLSLYIQNENLPHYLCICNSLPEDEPLGSKYIEDIKIKN